MIGLNRLRQIEWATDMSLVYGKEARKQLAILDKKISDVVANYWDVNDYKARLFNLRIIGTNARISKAISELSSALRNKIGNYLIYLATTLNEMETNGIPKKTITPLRVHINQIWDAVENVNSPQYYRHFSISQQENTVANRLKLVIGEIRELNDKYIGWKISGGGRSMILIIIVLCIIFIIYYFSANINVGNEVRSGGFYERQNHQIFISPNQ